MASIDLQRVTASARSVPGFNLIEAFSACDNLFVRYGGHSQAAGFTLARERIPELREKLSAIAAESMVERPRGPAIRIDAEVGLAELTTEALQWLHTLEPYGVGNPQPVFLTRGLGVVATQYVGRQGQHVKLRVRQGADEWTALMFSQAERWVEGISNVDLVYTLLTDYWNGERQVNLRVLDFRAAAP
jgi:single-stranded-DNA-specific exonuclease